MREVVVKLYRFSELDSFVQNKIAIQWRQMSSFTVEDERRSLQEIIECLATDPDEKYLQDGREIDV